MTDPFDPIRIDEWWRDVDCLCALWRWLEEQGKEPLDRVADFLEKGYRWASYWEQMQAEARSVGMGFE